MARPFVSVLIDTYNHERYIEQAIRSVMDQDFPSVDREIVVVDDGSTDLTPEIVRKFEPQLRLLQKANGGQASAFNAGIRECRGEIIAFLDGDDWWEPRKLTVVTREFEAHPQIGMVGHGIFEVDEEGGCLGKIVPERSCESRLRTLREGQEFLLLRAFLGTSRLAVRRELLAKILPLPAGLTIEADEFLATVATAVGGARILDEPLTNYRLHSGNLFQYAGRDTAKARRKYDALAVLVRELPPHLAGAGISTDVTAILTDSIRVDAERLRLSLGQGWSWETARVEHEAFSQGYREATLGYRLFHHVVLAFALLLPPRLFYRFRHWYSVRDLARFRRIVGEAAPVSPFPVRKVHRL